MQRLPTGPNTLPVSLFNPSLEPFTISHAQKEYTLPAYGIETFPKFIADRMASQLADRIISERGIVKNYQVDKEELLREIYI